MGYTKVAPRDCLGCSAPVVGGNAKKWCETCSQGRCRDRNKKASKKRYWRRVRREGRTYHVPLIAGYCQRCGEAFVGTPSQCDGRSYCSSECHNDLAAREAVQCEQCGKQFRHRGNARDANRFCSVRCAGFGRTSVAKRYREHCKAGYRLRLGAKADYRLLQRGKVRECSVCAVQWCHIPGRWATVTCGSRVCEQERKRRIRRKTRRKTRAQAKCRDDRSHRARAKKHGRKAEKVSRIKVFTACEWTCAQCGCPSPRSLMGKGESCSPELDHIIPLCRGGDHVESNCQLLCRDCNGLKGSMTQDEFAMWNKGLGGGTSGLCRHIATPPRPQFSMTAKPELAKSVSRNG